MTGLAVLIPFKARDRKSRLAEVLDQRQRRRFAVTMLLDVLAAFRSSGLLSRCFVVTSDPEVLLLAERSGAAGLDEPEDRGVNGAVEWAISKLKGEERFLVVPSDLPLLRPSEVRKALSMKSDVDCVISPSKAFDGTNLLFFSRKRSIALSYDANSFWKHVARAARRGLSLAVYCGRGVLFDVDSVDDFRALGRVRINTPSVKFAKKALARWAS